MGSPGSAAICRASTGGHPSQISRRITAFWTEFRAEQLSKPKNRDEGFVDAPLLFWSDVSDEITESTRVDGSDLFNEHSGRRPE
jgi:hypothetical protein